MQQFSFCFTVKGLQGGRAYRLKERVSCYTYTSNSTILSVSAFIINHFPRLRPPTITPDLYSKVKFNESFVDCSETHHPFQTAWGSYIFDLVLGDHAVYHQNTLFVEVPVEELPSEGLAHFFQEKEIKESKDNRERCSNIFDLPLISKVQKKIGIASYRPTSPNIFEPHLNTPALFAGNLYNNEDWRTIKIGNNEVPSVQELSTFTCIILPGSTYSISNNPPSIIKEAVNKILQAYHRSPTLKLIGVCFGHQHISQYFGAKVEKQARIDGIESIEYDQLLIKQYPFLQGIANIPKLFLSSHHGDHVTSKPEGFKWLAHSKSCEFQSLISDNGRIFTTQFHSEYFRSFMQRLQIVLRAFYGKLQLTKIPDPQSEDLDATSHLHSRLMLQCLRRFIDS